MNGLRNRFGFCYCGRIERRLSPRDVKRHAGKIDNTSVPAISTQIVRRAHKDAIDRTRFDTHRTKHALRVINSITGDSKSFSLFDFFLAYVDAIDWTRFRTRFTRDTCGQIKSMKPTVAGRNLKRFLRIQIPLRECTTVGSVGCEPTARRHPQSVRDGRDRRHDISNPLPHGIKSFSTNDQIQNDSVAVTKHRHRLALPFSDICRLRREATELPECIKTECIKTGVTPTQISGRRAKQSTPPSYLTQL